jgi:hypothetical protein
MVLSPWRETGETDVTVNQCPQRNIRAARIAAESGLLEAARLPIA